MTTSSGAVHDTLVALQDAANAALALGRVASSFSEVLTSIADLKTRVEALELAISSHRAEEGAIGKTNAGIQAVINTETRRHVETNTAAKMLGRTPQTLRKWACYEDWPLRPVRVNGRLAWAVDDIRRLLNCG